LTGQRRGYKDTSYHAAHFHPRFFKESTALMTGFHKLIFNNRLDCALSTSAVPNHINLWHFVSSLDNCPDGIIPPSGFSAPQLAQILTNFHVCFQQIFSNGCDYPLIPGILSSSIKWQGTFFEGLILTICHLLLLDIVVVWDEHQHSTPAAQGLWLTIGLLHQGLLMCIFKDWLLVAESEQQYCQHFIAFNLTDKEVLDSKTACPWW